jgi:uncharacterized membrane protein YraQ (UPF0718 family)
MLYLSALLGMRWQGAWLRSSLCRLLNKGPRPLRLATAGVAGAVTPFCSCTTIPGFAAILEAGLGLDTAMAFLIASPTIDPAGTMLLLMFFGPKLTAIYIVGCFTAAVAGGWILGKFFTMRDVNPVLLFGCAAEDEAVTWRMAAGRAWQYISRFWWVVVISTLLGFVLYDYVPAATVEKVSARSGLLAVPAAALLGVFVYAHMAVLIPAGAALLAKGMTPGVVLAFLASSAGISPPEIVLLRRMVSFRLTLTYVAVTLALIATMGLAAEWIGR